MKKKSLVAICVNTLQTRIYFSRTTQRPFTRRKKTFFVKRVHILVMKKVPSLDICEFTLGRNLSNATNVLLDLTKYQVTKGIQITVNNHYLGKLENNIQSSQIPQHQLWKNNHMLSIHNWSVLSLIICLSNMFVIIFFCNIGYILASWDTQVSPRYNESCASLENAKICEDDCNQQLLECALQCDGQGKIKKLLL